MKPFVNYHKNWLIWLLAVVVVVVLLSLPREAKGEEIYKITAYCACPVCCGKWSDGYFASGKEVYVGGIACNHMSFGTRVVIDDVVYTVEDRGSTKYFGTLKEPIKAIDIYFECHEEAKRFGVQHKKVRVIK